jgi:FlaA1/EpsC-like NDP-sugar epimerase
VLFRLSYKTGVLNHLQARKVLIIGAGLVGNELERQISAVPNSGLNIIGFLDDDPTEIQDNPRIIGSLAQARSIVKQYEIDDVVFALPMRAYEKVNSIVGDLHDLPVKV